MNQTQILVFHSDDRVSGNDMDGKFALPVPIQGEYQLKYFAMETTDASRVLDFGAKYLAYLAIEEVEKNNIVNSKQTFRAAFAIRNQNRVSDAVLKHETYDEQSVHFRKNSKTFTYKFFDELGNTVAQDANRTWVLQLKKI